MLLEQVWGYRHAADTRLVNVHVQRLRSKIERDPEHPEIVVTVRGIGYKAGEPQSALSLAAATPTMSSILQGPQITLVEDSASIGGGGHCRSGWC